MTSNTPNLMPSCPLCGHHVATLLGTLGTLTWVRCRDCGMDYSLDNDAGDTPDDAGLWDEPAGMADAECDAEDAWLRHAERPDFNNREAY